MKNIEQKSNRCCWSTTRVLLWLQQWLSVLKFIELDALFKPYEKKEHGKNNH